MSDDLSHAELMDIVQFTAGMYELGTALALFLTGISTLQAWNYFRNFPQDSTSVKTLVATVFTADMAHTGLLLHATYHFTVTSFGNFAALSGLVWSINTSVLLNGLIAFVVQTYYSLRVYRITSSRLIALGCWTLALVRVCLTVAEVATLFRSGSRSVTGSRTFRWEITATQVVGAVSDFAIAFFICASLLRRRTGFAHTDKLVDKIVIFAVGSGLLTAMAAVVECILCLRYPGGGEFLVPYSVIAKLFNNSLLASLNERDFTRREAATLSFKLTPTQYNSGLEFYKSQPAHTHTAIELPTTTQDVDHESQTKV